MSRNAALREQIRRSDAQTGAGETDPGQAPAVPRPGADLGNETTGSFDDQRLAAARAGERAEQVLFEQLRFQSKLIEAGMDPASAATVAIAAII